MVSENDLAGGARVFYNGRCADFLLFLVFVSFDVLRADIFYFRQFGYRFSMDLVWGSLNTTRLPKWSRAHALGRCGVSFHEFHLLPITCIVTFGGWKIYNP